ncbi:MAG: hypothetical protein P9M15_06165 [Candidatus Electryoneaceae bacterium]|nr:hypothetical protein [Candidatus Electryoneaceae bacterium]
MDIPVQSCIGGQECPPSPWILYRYTPSCDGKPADEPDNPVCGVCQHTISKRSRIIVAIIILSVVLSVMVGCGEIDETVLDHSYISGLADTIYAGEPSRQVLLTDGTGGYYYDDALREEPRGEYGYCRWGDRLVAGWEVITTDGIRLDDDVDYCIVHPEWVERHYLSGLIERIESPFTSPPTQWRGSKGGVRLSGLLVSFQSPTKGIIFRPQFDFQPVSDRRNTQSSVRPDYSIEWNREHSALTITSNDQQIAVACPNNAKFTDLPERHNVSYAHGALTGDVPEAQIFIPGDISVKGSADILVRKKSVITFAFSPDRHETASAIISSQDQWRSERREWSLSQLNRLMFRCDDKRIERGFAWARITLAKLIVENNDGTYLLTGIPHSPYGKGWHSCLSIAGLSASQQDVRTSYDILTTLINRQTAFQIPHHSVACRPVSALIGLITPS